MKIIFLCGSVEPGRDGVGDYVRRLSGELMNQGHQISIIALNDKYIQNISNCLQTSEKFKVNVLRLPSIWPIKRRFLYARQMIKSENPHWISLQFVLFSFHPKGLPFTLYKYLKVLCVNRYLHIMFHELWVGMEQDSNLKLVWWGRIQRWLIHSLILSLRPNIIHTQTKLYQLQLVKMGLDAKYLPLFSNIPVANVTDIIKANAAKHVVGKNTISFVIFGAIYAGAPLLQFAHEAANYSKKNGVMLLLRILGRSGIEQTKWVSAWKSAELNVEVLGEQSESFVSDVLRNSDLGISTTPSALIDKSSVVATMREHGLPVLCVAQPWRAVGISAIALPPGIYEYKKGIIEMLLTEKGVFSVPSNVTDVSHLLVRTLSSYL